LFADDEYYKDDPTVLENCAADACCQANANDIGRCFEGSPTRQPGVMPTDPTKSPTVEGESADVVSTPVADEAVVDGSDNSDGTAGDSSSVPLPGNAGSYDSTSGSTSSGTSTSNAQGIANETPANGAQTTDADAGASQVIDAQGAATTGGSPPVVPDEAPANVKAATASKNSARRVNIVGSAASFVVATSLVWYMLG